MNKNILENLCVINDEMHTLKIPNNPSIKFSNKEQTGVMTFTKEGDIIWNDRKLEIDADVVQMVKEIHNIIVIWK